MDWRHRANCRGKDPELFFPVGEGDLARWQAARAKAICRGCAVLVACRDWARAHEDAGVWGGEAEQERRDQRRRQGRRRARPSS
ncbi:WhiB family transcriptional regulator [Pseudonocardia sp. WMMC193]|uniref:WhiB family transcriptional regulator n=1 Tax=Pseudonocardia sp. WMMC193 TaxID=2911965 RepID=UPI001F48450C|nr:WhiB family transcriptional regulator [Pseudonocardia sp. WMMC193]MCF7552603.1 WhiB family transcriptional regulator [Pseudonocardia sp. WMMC193]